MDAEILKTFLEEAESYLPTMRGGIIAYERDASFGGELETSRRQAHTIKGSALMLNLKEISEIAGEIESELKTVIQAERKLSEDDANAILSKILILESNLKQLRETLGEAILVSETTNDSEEVFLIPDSTENITIESVIEEFELDAEMLEVFSQEAEELLHKITLNLEILAQTPANRDALLEIRRSAHTLKGSAGIVGLKKLSALAHRVEDLLDYLSENEIENNEEIFELLLSSTDCLSALAGGEDSTALNEKIKRVYQNFDAFFASLKAEKPPDTDNSKKVSPPEIVKVNEIPKEKAFSFSEIKNGADGAALAVSKTSGIQLAEKSRASHSVIRVSVERINDLFNLVGEMVISRAVFEQRLRELERQIEEHHRTTRRLRVASERLETDFQSGILDTPSSIFNASAQIADALSLFRSSSPDFDALEFDRYNNFHQTTLELIEATADSAAINSGLDHLLENLNLLFDNQRRLIEEMQLNLLRLRIISLDSLAPRLQRTVRVTAEDEGKSVELVIENDSLEVETEILDALVEPLLHLLRNAVSHGIETPDKRKETGKPERGKITLLAYSEGTHVVFTVSDDGGGISISALKEKAVNAGFISKKEAAAMTDEEAYSLVFLPGLSTAPGVSQTSGRGVGMNVVNSSITRRHGTISIKSEAGKGTSFTIRLPMSLTATRAILVKAGTQTFAFPLNLVKEITEISGDEFEKAAAKKALTKNAVSYSPVEFSDLVNLPAAPLSEDAKIPLILLKTPESPCALAVDQILKTEEIVIKPLDSILKNIPEITGASILGDGTVIPVLDLVYLLKKGGEKGRKGEGEKRRKKENNNSQFTNSSPFLPDSLSPLLKILIVDDSPSVRQINSRLIKNAGWQVLTAKDGLEALEILQTSGEVPDTILTDVEMPRMDGYELLASLKRHPAWQKIPVIMITSRAGDKHRRKAFDLGANAYLIKPYEDGELLEKIEILTKNADKKI